MGRIIRVQQEGLFNFLDRRQDLETMLSLLLLLVLPDKRRPMYLT